MGKPTILLKFKSAILPKPIVSPVDLLSLLSLEFSTITLPQHYWTLLTSCNTAINFVYFLITINLSSLATNQ